MIFSKLSDLCTDIIDCPHSTPIWKESGVRIIRNFNIRNGLLDFSSGYYVDQETYISRTRRAIPEEGDIVISREAPIGMAAIIPKGLKCCLGQRLVLLKVNKKKCDPYYLLTVIMSEFVQKQFRRADVTGSIVSNLCIPDLKNITIPLMEEGQSNVAHIFKNINNGIILTNKINDNLEQQLRTIYDYWFTQFDFPDENGNPYRSSGGKMVWNNELKREIPEGWSVVPILDYVTWESNSQPPKSEFSYVPKEGYIRFIQNRDYDSDGYMTYIPYKRSLSIADRFDILMDKYGDAGATRYGIAGAFNVALGKIAVHNPIMQEYIRSWLSSTPIYSYLHNACMASTRASLSESNLALLKMLLPAKPVLVKYQEIAHKIRSLILKNADESRQCIALRDWLLPMLMNGQATVAN